MHEQQAEMRAAAAAAAAGVLIVKSKKREMSRLSLIVKWGDKARLSIDDQCDVFSG
jgi:hypothetical protein